ncbi:MAG: HEAT repeat domain-containing protein [Planctomycetes bacterium]|nr:HEAT repeat domain-containing protein [Planctomycetota bacterium]
MVRPIALALSAFVCAAAAAQHGSTQPDPAQPMFVADASDEARQKIPSIQLADGLRAELVAAEPDICNGVAFHVDDRGNIYVCETFRVRDGVFDNRNYMRWLDDDLGALTVADRVAKYHKHIPDKVAKLGAYSERIVLLADTDGDGTHDRVTTFAEGFTALEDGLIAGVLPVGDDVITTLIPKVWRLRDEDGDGVAERREVMFDGFGVHTSLMGHDMHGLIIGPDRRLYWSIGDRGFHVEHGGETFAYPHEGAVLRCELDGSDLEVVHRGLRNPQELAFDQWGDLITGDNNSDGGDKARLVQILPGADSGWRIGFQWLSDRGAWNREKMWHPRHPEQAADIVPPIRNFADGPSGLVYDPGVGLPDRFRDCFFLCDFRGGASYSGIRTFRLSRNGAGYEVRDHDKIAWNVLASDCDFGPDGSLYLFDWVHGWSKTGKGRIYKVRTPAMANDFKLRNNARLLGSDFGSLAKAQLQPLLAHQDRRIRQKAQFALVDLKAKDSLEAAATQRGSRLARLHGVWGLGILLRHGDDGCRSALTKLCGDDDADVRAMAARALGDGRAAGALPVLMSLLRDDNSRVKREAAFALARLGRLAAHATDPLFAAARHNDDRDAVLRHAIVYALGEVAPRDQLTRRIDARPRAVQRTALLALARQGAPEVARFLAHDDEQLRYEAARAIYETPIPAAMEALARLVYDDSPDSERVDWRAINAARMRGQVEDGEALVHLATLANHPEKTRLEALAVLAEWRRPHGQCRVIGNWRPCEHADAQIVAENFRGSADKLLADPTTAAAAARAIAQLELTELGDALVALVGNDALPTAARVAALDALAELQSTGLADAMATIDADAPVELRKRAVALLSKSAPAQAVPVLDTLLQNASIGERQAACQALGDLQHESATELLRTWLRRIDSGAAPAAIHLDILAAARKHPALGELVKAHEQSAAKLGPLGPYRICLDGGDPRQGRRVFHDFEATRCTRCHTLRGTGGNAGPVLDGVGKRLTPEQLLESLITPSARIAEGFRTTTLELTDSSVLAGVVTKDQDGQVTIVDINGKAHDVAAARIRSRRASDDSAMPAMGGSLSKRQLRDLIAFLKQQKVAKK